MVSPFALSLCIEATQAIYFFVLMLPSNSQNHLFWWYPHWGEWLRPQNRLVIKRWRGCQWKRRRRVGYKSSSWGFRSKTAPGCRRSSLLATSYTTKWNQTGSEDWGERGGASNGKELTDTDAQTQKSWRVGCTIPPLSFQANILCLE